MAYYIKRIRIKHKNESEIMTSIDDFTIHCVEMTIRELIMDNVDYQKNAENSNDEVAFLIFENRKLVLYELLGKVQHLKVSRKEHLERLKELK